MISYAYLAVAILAELVGTSALKLSDGMSRPAPGAVVVVGYGVAFWCMALALKTLPVGLVYAIWAGIGIAGIKAIGVVFFGESINPTAIAGTLLIIVGVVMVQLGSAAPR